MRERFVTFASSPTGITITAADVVQFRPVDVFEINIRKRYTVRNPSVVLFALASPALDDVP